MASSLKNLNEFESEPIGNFSKFKIGVVVAEWNSDITKKLLDGCIKTLEKYGVWDSNVVVNAAPGSYELSYGAHRLASDNDVDAVIALGCVIKGETKHDEYICHAVANGLTEVSFKFDKPVIFGLLTTNDLKQAEDRSGGKHGNKGVEAAVTALKMLQ